MKRAKIFSFVKIAEGSMVASVRIARFIADVLGLGITWDRTIADDPLDVLVIVNGAYAFAGNETLAGLAHAIENTERVVWVQNDYTVIPPKDESGAESPFRKAFRNRFERDMPSVDYWTTVDFMSRPGKARTGHHVGDLSTYLNWNVLTTDVQTLIPDDVKTRGDRLVYYGSFRKDRERYFDRYFTKPTIRVDISCPNSKFDKYAKSDMVAVYPKLENVGSWLSNSGLGLYLEDKKSHDEFHSPANRFYEMLSANLPIVFQPEAQRMMEKAGYEIGDHILWNAEEMPQALEKRHQTLEAQRPWLNKAIGDRALLPELVRDQWKRYQ